MFIVYNVWFEGLLIKKKFNDYEMFFLKKED